jgi:hypothetical protein
MTAVELPETGFESVGATASFTWGISYSPSDVEIIISALHNLTDVPAQELCSLAEELWGAPLGLVEGEIMLSVHSVMGRLRDGATFGEQVSLSIVDARLIALALDDLSRCDKGDVRLTYSELRGAHDTTLDQILAEDGELHRYAGLLRDATVKFVEACEAFGC